MPNGIVARRKHSARHRRLEPGGFVLFQRMQVVQATEKEQVRDQLDHFEWVGDAARPERVPDLIDLALDGAR